MSSDDPVNSDICSRARDLVHEAGRLLAFTGAGISTESGIPDYRSPGGVWERYRPVTIQEFFAGEEARIRYWTYKIETHRDFAGARPNAAHRALADLESTGRLLGIVTQNVDGLHQEAGVFPERVVELHGSNARVGCLDCGAEAGWESALAQWEAGRRPPVCADCGGFLKPRTISFGQGLRTQDLEQAVAWCRRCDLLVVVGTSLAVAPANQFPLLARDSGARLILVNRTPTPQDGLADAVLHAEAADILPEIMATA